MHVREVYAPSISKPLDFIAIFLLVLLNNLYKKFLIILVGIRGNGHFSFPTFAPGQVRGYLRGQV